MPFAVAENANHAVAANSTLDLEANRFQALSDNGCGAFFLARKPRVLMEVLVYVCMFFQVREECLKDLAPLIGRLAMPHPEGLEDSNHSFQVGSSQ